MRVWIKVPCSILAGYVGRGLVVEGGKIIGIWAAMQQQLRSEEPVIEKLKNAVRPDLINAHAAGQIESANWLNQPFSITCNVI